MTRLDCLVVRPFLAFATYIVVLVTGILMPNQGWSQSREDPTQTTGDLVVVVRDHQSQPVKGAKVGFSACFGDLSFESPSWLYLPNPASQERFPREVQSDEHGIVRLKDGKKIASNFRVSLVARHQGRHLCGITNLSRAGNEDVEITLYPECKITGTLVCQELANRGLELDRNSVSVSFDGMLCVEHHSLSSEFELFLPPGEFSLSVSGLNGGTLTTKRSLLVPEGVAEMKLHVIQLSLKGSRQREGLPAPEISNVIAWKGDGPKSLKDLKGNVVLLDFWGHWCHACVAKLPQLSELDKRYRERGLKIIGLHIDVGNRITSLSEYEAYEKTLEMGVLKGSSISYPIALLAENPTPFRGNSEKDALCKVAADYGVNSYPTMILIDREGNVAGEFRDSAEGRSRLERLLLVPESE